MLVLPLPHTRIRTFPMPSLTQPASCHIPQRSCHSENCLNIIDSIFYFTAGKTCLVTWGIWCAYESAAECSMHVVKGYITKELLSSYSLLLKSNLKNTPHFIFKFTIVTLLLTPSLTCSFPSSSLLKGQHQLPSFVRSRERKPVHTQ